VKLSITVINLSTLATLALCRGSANMLRVLILLFVLDSLYLLFWRKNGKDGN